eukprot:TRINITY_DN1431_c0_g1_i1.p1 TRINITY_DN1431_c0_g1~~TRINITY_DN1431_c0_g1_i1.p1  ORF type:complete len:481 (+),score=131.66 TRINITY_DN1431_c0_g1_i1:23-1465(+)
MASVAAKRLNIVNSHITPNPTLGSYLPSANDQGTEFLKILPETKAIKPTLRWWYKLSGWLLVGEGETYILQDIYGQYSLVTGPCSTFIFRKSYAVLPRFTANASQYVEIQNLDGTTENLMGPVSVLYDPRVHEAIAVRDSVVVQSGYAIVVYKKQESSDNLKEMERQIIYGPAVYSFKPNERIDEFFWQIPLQSDPTTANRKLIRFKKLRVIPDQLYLDIVDVRTSDDALLRIKIMVFFQLVNIQKLLERSHDPVTEITNFLTASIIDFVGQRTFKQFKEDSNLLNLISTYSQVVEFSTTIGYDVFRIVYRGYLGSERLQAMHNEAIEARTKLELEKENEVQTQDLNDLKQSRVLERGKRDRNEEEEKGRFEIEMKRRKHEEEMRIGRLDEERALEKERNRGALMEERRRKENDEKLRFLEREKGLEAEGLKRLSEETGLDVTAYMVAKERRGEKVINVVESAAADDRKKKNRVQLQIPS